MTYPIDPTSELWHILRVTIHRQNPDALLAFEIAQETGLRVSDIIRLKTPTRRKFSVIERKTKKPRTVELSPELFSRLKARGGEYIFPGKSEGYHLHRDTIGHALKRAARALKLPEGFGMHSARKMYALDLFEKTGNLFSVQSALNHAHSDTTLRYLFLARPLGDEYLKTVQEAFSNGNRK